MFLETAQFWTIAKYIFHEIIDLNISQLSSSTYHGKWQLCLQLEFPLIDIQKKKTAEICQVKENILPSNT